MPTVHQHGAFRIFLASNLTILTGLPIKNTPLADELKRANVNKNIFINTQ